MQIKCNISLACKSTQIRYFDGMIESWQDRLRGEINKALSEGASMRSLSEAAGLNPNYVGQLMQGSQPTVQKFLALCDTLEKDPVEILTGVKQENPELMRALRLFASWPESRQKKFLDWIEDSPSPTETDDQNKLLVQADPSGS